jgi:hypothetical protein
VLETRQLLSSVFAHLDDGRLAAGGHETIVLKVAPRDFQLPTGRALLGFAMTETGGTSGQMMMVPPGHVLLHRANQPGARPS